jgi:tetratricopeptide (TPR) repeat protein
MFGSRTKTLLLFAAVMTISIHCVSATAQNGPDKKELEKQAKQVAAEAKALEDGGQLKDAEQKYDAAEAIISTGDGRAGLDRVHKAEAKKFQELMAESKALYDSGRPTDAITKLHEAQALQPGNPALHYNLALCYSKLGDRLKAVAEMDQTLAALPENDKNRDQLEQVRSAMMTGETPATLSPDAKQRVDSFNSQTAKSLSLVSSENGEGATPSPTPASQIAALPCTQLKDLEPSLPKSPSVLFNLAKCAEEDGRQEDALKYLNQYLATAPTAVDKEDVNVRLSILTSLSKLDGDKGKQVRAHYAAATRFIDDRRYDQAIEELVKAQQILPDYPLTKWRLALLYEAMGNVQKSREFYMSYRDLDKTSDEANEAAKRVALLDKERSDYESAIKDARQTIADLLTRTMGLAGQGNGAKSYTGGRIALGFAAGRRPVASGTGGVSFEYAQQQIESAHKKLEEATGIFPLGPEANELLGFVYMQSRNPSAAMRCYDIVKSEHYPVTFYARSFSAHDRKAMKETKIELVPDRARLIYLSSYNPKTKSNDAPAKAAGNDGLGNLVISDSEPQISDADLLALKTADLKGVETKESYVELNHGGEEIFLEPLNITSDTPFEGVPARKFANNYTRLFLRYMGYDNTKLGKESMTGGEKFSLGMSFAAAGMSGYSAIASGGYLMASTTQMMLAMYSFNAGMSSLKESRAEDRQILEGNQFKLIPSQSFDLAFKDKFE